MVKSSPAAVVFDLGGVLLDWNPRYLYRSFFNGDEEKMEWFLSHVCTPEWNATFDSGRPFAEGVAERIESYPAYASEIEAYDKRWPEMLSGSIPGTVDLLRKLADRGVPLYGLTNWSHEKYGHAAAYPFMSHFNGVVVSGFEGVQKPDPEIFRILLDRYGLEPSSTLYIDDVEANTNAARSLGFQVVLFTDPDTLAGCLKDVGLLAPN